MTRELAQSITELTEYLTWSGGPCDRQAAAEEAFHPEHLEFLAVHDGLMAFDGGLRCFGTRSGILPSLREWNRPDGWRSAYRTLTEGLQFFGEDVLGNQFAFEDERVVRFLGETAEREFMADSLREWIEALLKDPGEELALWLLEEWKRPDRALKPSEYLCPTVPFAAGGAFKSENLYPLDRQEGLTFKGDFAWQTRNLPEGAKIRLRVTD